MEITVKMTEDEFHDFARWRKDKKCYDAELVEIDGKFEYLNNKVLWALEPDEKHPGRVKIINQEHAAELVEMASEWFA